jgi:hypothetical protein
MGKFYDFFVSLMPDLGSGIKTDEEYQKHTKKLFINFSILLIVVGGIMFCILILL